MNYSPHKTVLIWQKTKGHCAYCGRVLDPSKRWIIEHMIPKSQGGTNRVENLIPSCERCNRLKKTKNVEQYRDYLFQGFADDLEGKYLERVEYLRITITDDDYDEIEKRVKELVELLYSLEPKFYFELEVECSDEVAS